MDGLAQPLGEAHRNLVQAADVRLSAQARGRALEDSAAAFFESVPGCTVPRKRSLDYAGSSEVDLVISNRQREDGLWFLPQRFLVECKNSDRPVSSSEVTVFASKLRDRNCAAGMLVAASGVTGSRSEDDASYHVAMRQLTAGIRILLLTTLELRATASSEQFVNLLHAKDIDLIARCTFSADG